VLIINTSKITRFVAGICSFIFLCILSFQAYTSGLSTTLTREMGGLLIFLLLAVLILLHLGDIGDLSFHAMIRTSDKVQLVIASIVFVGMSLLFGQTWYDAILSILAAMVVILGVLKRGISSKGFNMAYGFNVIKLGGYWDKLKEVEVSLQEDVKVLIIKGRYWPFYKEIHHYEKKDYDKVITLLFEHLPREKVNIK